MQPKFVVKRMDILTRKIYPTEELFRLVKEGGRLLLDLEKTRPGRGIYLHKDIETVEKAQKKKILLRYDKGDLQPLFEEMKNALER